MKRPPTIRLLGAGNSWSAYFGRRWLGNWRTYEEAVAVADAAEWAWLMR